MIKDVFLPSLLAGAATVGASFFKVNADILPRLRLSVAQSAARFCVSERVKAREGKGREASGEETGRGRRADRRTWLRRGRGAAGPRGPAPFALFFGGAFWHLERHVLQICKACKVASQT